MRSYTYILTNKPNGSLYVGVTSNLQQRIWQHKYHPTGFVLKYKLSLLVYYEQHLDIYTAIAREKQLKNWKRAWKIELIKQHNPSWNDLYSDLF